MHHGADDAAIGAASEGPAVFNVDQERLLQRDPRMLAKGDFLNTLGEGQKEKREGLELLVPDDARIADEPSVEHVPNQTGIVDLACDRLS